MDGGACWEGFFGLFGSAETLRPPSGRRYGRYWPVDARGRLHLRQFVIQGSFIVPQLAHWRFARAPGDPPGEALAAVLGGAM